MKPGRALGTEQVKYPDMLFDETWQCQIWQGREEIGSYYYNGILNTGVPDAELPRVLYLHCRQQEETDI